VRKPREGHWEKILKRYLTLLSYLRDDAGEPFVPTWLQDFPGLRESVYRYYLRLGPSQRRRTHIRGFIRSGYCVDDASFFLMARLLVEWPVSKQAAGSMRAFIVSLRSGPFTAGRFQGLLWMCIKYCSTEELGRFIVGTRSLWTTSAWAARQVAACIGLLNRRRARIVHHALSSGGLLEALRVYSTLVLLFDSKLDAQVRAYLKYPPRAGFPYSLSKMVLARSLLLRKHAESAWVLRNVTPCVRYDAVFSGQL